MSRQVHHWPPVVAYKLGRCGALLPSDVPDVQTGWRVSVRHDCGGRALTFLKKIFAKRQPRETLNLIIPAELLKVQVVMPILEQTKVIP